MEHVGKCKPDESASTNRRGERRHPLISFVWFQIIDDTEPSDEYADWASSSGCIARSCDISAGGIGITASQSCPVGSKVFMEISTGGFHISAAGQAIHARCTTEGQFRIGINFLVVPPNDRIRLRKTCDAA
jgi:hypothetical protein